MPVSLIEAGLAGVPAVATNVGSVAEVIKDGSTGLLTRCDADEIARSVIRLLRDDELRRQMGRAAASWSLAQFGPERLVADVERVYETIAVDRGWWPDPTDSDRHAPVAQQVAAMRVLVTGAAGFIGANLCRELGSRPDVTEVIGLDDLSTGDPANLSGTGCRPGDWQRPRPEAGPASLSTGRCRCSPGRPPVRPAVSAGSDGKP